MMIVFLADPLHLQHGDEPWQIEEANLNLVADFVARCPRTQRLQRSFSLQLSPHLAIPVAGVFGSPGPHMSALSAEDRKLGRAGSKRTYGKESMNSPTSSKLAFSCGHESPPWSR